MVLFGESVVFVCGTSPLQDETPVCHDCLMVNGTSKFIINTVYLHGTAARVLTSGHPPETIIRVLTYGHSPGPLNRTRPRPPSLTLLSSKQSWSSCRRSDGTLPRRHVL